MKVAYITMRFPAASETFTCTDIRALCHAGIDVSVYAMRTPQGDPVALLKERGLAELPVSQRTFIGDLKSLVYWLGRPMLVMRLLMWVIRVTWSRPVQLMLSLALVPRSVGIIAELEHDRPDVVHLFWGHYPCIVGYLVLTACPNSILSLFLGAYDLTRSYGGTAWVAQRADVVSTHARWNFSAIEALGVRRERIHLAYRGVDLTTFSPKRGPKVNQRIVSAGRLEEGKGMDDVLRVFQEIHVRWPGATLRVLGQGPDRAELERLSRSLGIEGAVTFVGHVPHKDVESELRAAEVFLLMSWDETERLPNVVKEAMASKCLCVVTETSGIDELVKNGEYGFVVPRRDVRAAIARVDEVFSGRVEVASIVAQAASHIVRFFNAAESMRSYRQRWEDAIVRRRGRLRAAPLATVALPAETSSPTPRP